MIPRDSAHFRSRRLKLQAFTALFSSAEFTTSTYGVLNMSKKKPHQKTSKTKVSRFAILEDALRITYIIIKIAIAIVVPSGKHIYDPGVIF